MKSEELRDWTCSQPESPWNELLKEAIEAYALETSESETPVASFIEWLAEWGREVRHRQHRLLLLTAHRAKGLEFDHVVVLDGGWDRIGRGEDRDAPRRLHYVAMTRAKRSLTVADVDRGNPFRHTLLNSPSVLVRSEKENIPPAPAELVRQYRRLKLSEVFLGFAGYRHPAHRVHRAIAALSPGDILQVRGADERWELLNREGVVVGQLARGLEKPAGMRCVFTTVTAVVSWERERSEPEYQDRMVCDKWKVVVPELAFEPVSVSDAHRGRFACR